METIFAEATPPGKGGISIVRLSGPDSWPIATALIGAQPAPRQAVLRRLVDEGEVIDSALVILFPKESSFTGEPVVEFQLHGVPVVVDRLCQALRARGARQAQAGEFTRRAFVNGRLDLIQIQGLSDLLAAETEAQRQLAMRNADGELSRMAAEWRKDLTEAAAMLIASIDFPDEDTGPGPERAAAERIAATAQLLEKALSGAKAAEIVRHGAIVAIVGPPNAGKSTLLNRLARRDVAIVSKTPGTTRDVIEVHLDLGGHAVTVLDTAGMRATEDVIEAVGVARARKRAMEADLRIHLAEDGRADQALFQDGDLVVRAKVDHHSNTHSGLGVSGLTGEGVDALIGLLAGRLREMVAGAGLVAHRIQRERIDAARIALAGAADAEPEIMAEAVRAALYELEALLGRADIEEQLDVIFARFCIGK